MKSIKEHSSVLIGNGLNRAVNNQAISWEKLLKKIAENCNPKVDTDNEFKPYPLLFEEILHNRNGEFKMRLKELKNEIARLFYDAKPSNLHKTLVKSGFSHILTTNYDYTLEKVINPNFINEKGQTQRNSTNETLNSLRRRSIFKSTHLPVDFPVSELSIWHIHGEIKQRLAPSKRKLTTDSNSIMIGYEHYGNYLAEIQKYLKGERRPGTIRIIERVQSEPFQIRSWVDFFFFGTLHITGFNFDFSENHLWWLLNYRANLLSSGILKPKKASKIIYYYHEIIDDSKCGRKSQDAQLQKRKLTQAKLDLFKALKVETVPIKIPLNKYKKFYNQFIDCITKQ